MKLQNMAYNIASYLTNLHVNLKEQKYLYTFIHAIVLCDLIISFLRARGHVMKNIGYYLRLGLRQSPITAPVDL
ncbi:hypothetical protein ACOMHN_056709 [Nucella lapillus]